jgi:hypothetical protein
MLAKNLFGDDHEIQYDTIINHDVYSFLRISLEVPRGQKEKAILLLNGKEIGEIIVKKDGKTTLGYTAIRYHGINPHMHSIGFYEQLGLACAAIITDYIPKSKL